MFSGNQWHVPTHKTQEEADHLYLNEDEWRIYGFPDLAFHIRYEQSLAVVYHRESKEG